MRLLLRMFITVGLASALGFASGTTLPTPPQHKAKHAASGWQPGGPLRPLYQSAVKAVHNRDFDSAEALCHKGLKLAKGDKAFTDLLAQIPQWRKDTLQAQVAAQYAKAVSLVHEGHLDAGERACRKGLALEPGNTSFTELLRDIASRRNADLQNFMLECYQQAATLMNEGKYQRAEAKCKEGLDRQPGDVELKALLKRIRAKRNGNDS